MPQRGYEWSPYGHRQYERHHTPFWREIAVTDLIYLALGVGVVLLFVGYAALLRRA